MTTFCINKITGASTRFTGYDFNSMFRGTDGKYYGVKADGIYLLEGEAEASVDFGDINFGTSLEKRLMSAYAGCQSEQPLVLEVTQCEETYDYPARSASDCLNVVRFDLGRGLRANYYGIAIKNQDGTDFTIDSVELTALPTTRRI